MKIALFISPSHCVPPTAGEILAPWWIVKALADGLVKRGHDVTLFSARESETSAKLEHFDISQFHDRKKDLNKKDYLNYAAFWDQRLAAYMYKVSQEGRFDIINSHLAHRVIHFAPFTKTPTVFTFHDPLTDFFPDLYKTYNNVPQISYISISNAQRGKVALPFSGTVYNGIDLDRYPFGLGETGNLMTSGRIMFEKGIFEAVKASLLSKTPLAIAGIYDPRSGKSIEYWEKDIKPFIDNNLIKHLGLLVNGNLVEHYKRAKALLFPIQWEEPFGLVMTEAMACGTPVIAYNRGSVSEVVRDGVTGFIVDSDDAERLGKGSWIIKKQGIEGLVEAVMRIGEIDRKACRKHVEDNFSIEKMIDGYENVYKKILGEIK
jgi:glycosyltransferase involved in cell wall biosynthesis